MYRQDILLDAMEMKEVQGKRYRALVMTQSKHIATVCASSAHENYDIIGIDSGEQTESLSAKNVGVLGQRDDLASRMTLCIVMSWIPGTHIKIRREH